MFTVGIVAIAFGVFFCSWVCHHGLPMMGMHVDTEDSLLLSDVIGEDILEA
ncbi:hypothetical protein [Vibrio sinensis]|uniref:hypothetical protein n=1 Tax=Vibrio sinensis TaxID=2302434 RepID=UPI00140254FF|nr:hypothetical protein [Vibrio sinensis]